MRALFNTTISIQAVEVGADDADGNKTYTYENILVDEGCRAYESSVSKLTDDKNWITYKIKRWVIMDVDTDLTQAAYVVHDSNYYKIERIISPQSFARIKHRIIETTYKEGKE